LEHSNLFSGAEEASSIPSTVNKIVFVPLAFALLAAYVVGSIDFAVIIGRMHGVDIHEVGSGNPGTSNVLRTLGKGPAIMVLLGDTLKGVIGAAMGWVASGDADPLGPWVFAAGLAAVIGHCYPVFHKFRGGKGVATGFGVLIFTMPLVAVIVGLSWAILTKITKTASVSSMIVVSGTIPLAFWQGVSGMAWVWLLATIALVVWRHKANIQRMARGTEEKVTT
jgi:glycerol-3-phosphate acyltransferase PlsY